MPLTSARRRSAASSSRSGRRRPFVFGLRMMPGSTKYEQLFGDIRAAFNKAYVTPEGRIKGDTQWSTCWRSSLNSSPTICAQKRSNISPTTSPPRQPSLDRLRRRGLLLPVLAGNGSSDPCRRVVEPGHVPLRFLGQAGRDKEILGTLGRPDTHKVQDEGHELGFSRPLLARFVRRMALRRRSQASTGTRLPGYSSRVHPPAPGRRPDEARASLRIDLRPRQQCLDRRQEHNSPRPDDPPNTTATVTLPATDADGITKRASREIEVASRPVDGNATFSLGFGHLPFRLPS